MNLPDLPSALDSGDLGPIADAARVLLASEWPADRAVQLGRDSAAMRRVWRLLGEQGWTAVAADATLEEIIERKMHECVRGLRGHGSANLHGLMVGLVEKPLLRAVMRETRGNQVRAAQLLGINRNTLRKKLKEHSIDPDAV